jgi:hypothetical protein
MTTSNWKLLDHIATEIESIIDESRFHLKKIKKSFRKMEKRTITSLWIRNNKSIPKIVIHKNPLK